MISDPHPVDILIGTNLQSLRLKAGMSVADLAAEIGESCQQVQRYERGVDRLSAWSLWECAHALGSPLSSLFKLPARAATTTHDNAGG